MSFKNKVTIYNNDITMSTQSESSYVFDNYNNTVLPSEIYNNTVTMVNGSCIRGRNLHIHDNTFTGSSSVESVALHIGGEEEDVFKCI